MKKVFYFVLTVIMLIVSKPNVYSQAGALDDTFDNDGIAMFDLSVGFHETAWDMAVLADTSILLCGNINDGSFSISNGFLLKLIPDGSIDINWGTNGLVTFDLGLNTYPNSMEILSDGKILVSGSIYDTYTDSHFFVAKFNTDGSSDDSFGINGVFTSSYSNDQEVGECMAIQSDGKIVVGGSTSLGAFTQLLFLRINTDGTIDNSFGTNGYTEISSSIQDEVINAIGILSNGTIVGTGEAYQSNPYYSERVIIAKLHNNGNPMTSFGTGGVIVPSWVTGSSSATDIEIKNDSLFITGYQYSVDADLFLSKLDSSGIADPAFATNGVSMFDLNIIDNGFDLDLSNDQKIYVCGNTGLPGAGADKEFLLLRYLSNGSLDPSFNTSGYVTTDIRNDSDAPFAVKIQVDGKIVLGGMSSGITTSGNNDVAVTRYLNDYIPFSASFFASETLICEGSTISFTDQTYGNPISWNWTFEGGSPNTSTAQNPSVTYNTSGTYDVQLIVSDGANSDTLLKEEYITVSTIPGQATIPVGPDEVCGGETVDYTTTAITSATAYFWMLEPSDAGTITGSGTTGTFTAATDWTGAYTVKVRAENECGNGSYSPTLPATLYFNPTVFFLDGGGSYCEGSGGLELTLDSSETGVDYELYFDATATGNIVAGTGNSISFGFQTDLGLYSAVGYTSNCSENMMGQPYISIIGFPGQPDLPVGPEAVCNNIVSTYTSSGSSDADTLIWILDPSSAGVMNPGIDMVDISWDSGFIGTANLSCYGSNDCGDGDISPELEITVSTTPTPEITGLTMVCEDDYTDYSTQDNPGNTYEWEVSGGTIISGAGTHQVYVEWGDPGSGYVKVTEDNGNCSTTTEQYEIIIDECPAIGEIGLQEFNVYPNPARNVLNIHLNTFHEMKDGTISMINIHGNVIKSVKVTEGLRNIRINTSGCAPGLYYVQIIEDDRVIAARKVVIVQ